MWAHASVQVWQRESLPDVGRVPPADPGAGGSDGLAGGVCQPVRGHRLRVQTAPTMQVKPNAGGRKYQKPVPNSKLMSRYRGVLFCIRSQYLKSSTFNAGLIYFVLHHWDVRWACWRSCGTWSPWWNPAWRHGGRLPGERSTWRTWSWSASASLKIYGGLIKRWGKTFNVAKVETGGSQRVDRKKLAIDRLLNPSSSQSLSHHSLNKCI